MDPNFFIFFVAPFILTMGLAAFLFFSLIPKTVESYFRFRKLGGADHFTAWVSLGTFSVALMLIVYCSLVRYYIVFTPQVPGVIRWLAGLGLFILSFALLVPSAYRCFEKWKATHKAAYLGVMALWAFLSFLIVSFVTFRTLFAILDVKNGL